MLQTKITYSRKTSQGYQQAGLDLETVFHWVKVEREEGNYLILHLLGNNVDVVEQVPQYNKKGEVVDFRATKLSQNPVVELHLQEDIDKFLNYWNG